MTTQQINGIPVNPILPTHLKFEPFDEACLVEEYPKSVSWSSRWIHWFRNALSNYLKEFLGVSLHLYHLHPNSSKHGTYYPSIQHTTTYSTNNQAITWLLIYNLSQVKHRSKSKSTKWTWYIKLHKNPKLHKTESI